MDAPTPNMGRSRAGKFARYPAVVGTCSVFDCLDVVGVHVPDGFSAPAECPGAELHTVETYVDDCVVIHDRRTNRIWIQCDHTECAFEVEVANRRLANLLSRALPASGSAGSSAVFDF